MEKKELYKWIAIGIVLIFVLEGIAIGMLSNPAQPSGPGDGSGGISTTGRVETNVTIVRYEPYVIVGGNLDALEQAKQGLIDSGIATYAVRNGQNLVVNLRSGADVVAAGAAFEKANGTVYASASINTPSKVRVDAEDVSTEVEGTSFSMQIRPIFEEGATVPATFTVAVENGKIVSLGEFSLLPAYVAGAVVFAPLSGEPATSFDIEVAWPNRTAAKEIARQQGAAFTEKSYIIVANATAEQLSAVRSAGSSFVTQAQQNRISVRNGFEDAELANSVLSSANLTGEYPPSVATTANQSSNGSASALYAAFEQAGIVGRLNERTVAKVALPSEFEVDGKKYTSEGVEFEIDSRQLSEGGAWVRLDFETTGSAVYRIISVSVLPGPPAGAMNESG